MSRDSTSPGPRTPDPRSKKNRDRPPAATRRRRDDGFPREAGASLAWFDHRIFGPFAGGTPAFRGAVLRDRVPSPWGSRVALGEPPPPSLVPGGEDGK